MMDQKIDNRYLDIKNEITRDRRMPRLSVKSETAGNDLKSVNNIEKTLGVE